MATRSRDAKDYTVGWLCALPIELAAARLCLDENHGDLVYDPNDCTHYTLGNIGAHNVVIGCLSAGQIGTNSAATIAAKMNAKFRNLRFGLMVGIGGGVPGQSSGGSRDVRLGDVVVSQPASGHGGVIQYDFGKSASDGFVNTGFLNAPPQILLQALTKVQARHLGGETATLATHLAAIEQQRNFRRPSAADVLFKATYEHVSGETCKNCKGDEVVDRELRQSNEIVVHYGTIASGNRVMKSARERDRVSAKFNGILCFEMEAAGLMNSFPCVVIRGIADYADSHKNKNWQPYAAATAAAYAKELLSAIPAGPTQDEIYEELKSLVDPARRDAVTVDQFIPCLSPVNRFALTQSPGDCNADESSKFHWVFKNMDYEAWDTANQSAVLLLSGPTVCDIRQVSFSIIQREIEMARAGGSFVLYFLWTPEIAESPVAIHTLLNQLLRQLPPDEQTSCVRHFLNRLLEHRFKLRETPGWGKSFRRDEPLQTKIGHILDAPVEELWSALTVPLISENSKSKRFSVILDGLHYIERERNTYFNGVRSFVERIQEKTTNFKFLLTSLPLVDIKNTFGSFPYIEHDKERKACLDTLRFENTRYGKISREHQGSFRWIWKHNEYLSWSTPNSSRLLYIQGKPGSGKSTLTKYFSQRLKKRDPAVASAIVAKFFYSEREGQRRHHYMLRSILYDILQQDEPFFYHRFQGEYRKQVDKGAGDVWEYESLKTVLQSLADYSAPTERRLYLIIDAVDESSDDDRRNIIKLLFSICGEAKFCIKVFVASRPLGSLEVSRTKFHNFIRLQDETKEDIRRFASSLLDGLELIHYFSEATDYIVNNAYGVFIWVKLVGQELLVCHEEGYSEEAVFELLKELPTELEQFYIRMFRRMNGDRRNISDGSKVFHFVLLARRPPKVIELLHALAIPGNIDTTFTLDTDISEDNFQRRIPPLQRIISCSGNFLEARSVHDGSIGRMSVDSLYNHTVQFMHQTAREFFLSTENCVAESQFRFIGDKAHGNIFITCIRYLTLCMRGISERFPRGELWTLQRFRDCAGYLNERPLVSYALSHLKYHASKCNGDPSLSILVKQFIDEMYRTKGIYLLGRWASGNFGCQPPSSDEESGAWEFKQYLLHAAVWNGLAQATEILILASADGTVEDKDGRTMIWWAAAVGHERVLEALIHTRTNVKISKAANIADCNGRTPLSIAAEQGHDKAVGIILRTNMVDANAGDHWEQTPLWWAAKEGNEKVVAALLEALVDVNKPNRDKQTPLSIAAEGGHGAVVKLILATGKAGVGVVDRTKWTPLSWAAHEGHYGVVCQLLSSDKVRVDCEDIWNRTPLLIAAERGHKEVVKVLLEKGNADIESVDEDGWTPLIAATKKGNREVVNFLLGKMTSRNPIFD